MVNIYLKVRLLHEVFILLACIHLLYIAYVEECLNKQLLLKHPFHKLIP